MNKLQPYFGARFLLQGRTESSPEWGTYSSAIVEQAQAKDTVEFAERRAINYLEDQKSRWQNYDRAIDFRIVQDARGL